MAKPRHPGLAYERLVLASEPGWTLEAWRIPRSGATSLYNPVVSASVEVNVQGPGTTPRYASDGASGADLYASEAVSIPPGGRTAVPTALHVELPPGYVALIWPRSGLAVRHGIDTLAGVIDSDYRGEVRVVLVNHGDEPFTLEPGDRVAQLLVQKVERARFLRTDNLTESTRGHAGFGSTGR